MEMENNEIREDVMEETTAMVPAVEEDVAPENYEASYTDAESSTGSVGGFIKLAAIGVGAGLVVKKFIYDRRIKPMIEARRAKKKAAEEEAERERIKNMLTEFGVIVPTTTADPVPEVVEAEEVNSEETDEGTK